MSNGKSEDSLKRKKNPINFVFGFYFSLYDYDKDLLN